MDQKSVNSEVKRLYKLLDRAEVPKQKQDALGPVIDNIAWLRFKLDDTRAEMLSEGVIAEYDNGGSQKGTHLNPIFKGYTELWKAYTMGLKIFLDYIPSELQDEVAGAGEDILSKVIKMKKAK